MILGTVTITLITGANKGLGRETARQLLKVGHTVLVGARDALALSRIAMAPPRGDARARPTESELAKRHSYVTTLLQLDYARVARPAKSGYPGS